MGASKALLIKQFAWISIVPQLLLIELLIYIYHLLDFVEPFILGALTYSIIAFGLRNLIAKNHRQGIKLVKKQKFADAIIYFEKGVDYFLQIVGWTNIGFLLF
jgi:hypothetical protein